MVEFALVAPTLIALMLGVLGMGMGMQKYNAMRNVASDVARYAVVNYQTNNRLTTSQLSSYARTIAVQAPYYMENDQVTIAVTQPGAQRVADAVEYQISITYRISTLLSVIGIPDFDVTYSRPIFVISG